MLRSIALTLCVGCNANPGLPPVIGIGHADLSARNTAQLGAERDALTSTDTQVGRVSQNGDRAVWAERVGSGPATRLLATDESGTWVLLPAFDGLAIDRPVLSSDGTLVAFVYAPHGIASVGVIPFRGGVPVQLTNVGMERKKRAPGQPPEGFVAVPSDDSLVFVGDRLQWDTPQGRMSVRLPRKLFGSSTKTTGGP